MRTPDCMFEKVSKFICAKANTNHWLMVGGPKGDPRRRPKEFDIDHDRPLFLSGDLNLLVECGQPIEDGYLCIIDVDVHSGAEDGYKNLHALERDLGLLPDTIQVRTPSGGMHYWFKTTEPMLFHTNLAKSVEFYGKGFVMSPFSKKLKGEYQVIDKDAELQWLPQAFEDLANESRKPYFNANDISHGLATNVTDGERTEALKIAALRFRQAGVNGDLLIQMLHAYNEAEFKPPVPREKVEGFRTYCNYEIEGFDSEGATEPHSEAKNKSIIEVNTVEVAKQTLKGKSQLSECYSDSEGLVREIADQVLKSAKRQYEGFALASALQVVSGCAQGSYMGPNDYDSSFADFDLSLYQWLTAQAATGKDHYHRCTWKYLHAVDRRLVCPSVASNKALRAAMFGFNSAVSVIDELGDLMRKLASSRAQSYQTAILTDLKMLTNSLDILEFDMTGSKKPPPIMEPKFGMFGTGTKDSFVKLLGSEMIGSGLLSRFIVWPEPDLSEKAARPPFHVDPSTLRRLRAIFEVGLTAEGRDQDYDKQLNDFFAYVEGKSITKPETITPTSAQKVLAIEPAARMALLDFDHAQEMIFKRFRKDQDQGTNPGSIADRAGFLAKKVAAVHAVGRGSETITLKDMELGMKLAKYLSEELISTVRGNAGETACDRAGARIEAVLKELGESNLRGILRKMSVHVDVAKSALTNLWFQGKILCTDKNGMPHDLETKTSLPRGAIYKINLSV